MNYILINSLLKKLYPKVIILEATNGKEAIEVVKSQKLDIILMDVQMPIMDGIEATRQIKNFDHGKFADIPIVALTAGVSKKERDDCFQAGMSDFIAKPIDRSLLEKVIRKIVNYEHDIQPVTINSSEDETSHFQFTSEFSKLANEEISNLFTELNFAIVRNDQTEIAQIAHAIKGVSLNFKWENIANIAKDIETHASQISKLSPLWSQLMAEWNRIKKTMV